MRCFTRSKQNVTKSIFIEILWKSSLNFPTQLKQSWACRTKISYLFIYSLTSLDNYDLNQYFKSKFIVAYIVLTL